MKIDSFDNTLICEDCDLQTVLAFFKDKRKIPEYLERLVLEIILQSLYSRNFRFDTLDEYFKHLPDDFVKKTILDINSMFSNHSKVRYKQNHLSYLLYYLSANVFKVWKPLLDLLISNTLKPNMRILDIGTGPGSVPIGIIEFYRALAENFTGMFFSLTFILIEAEQEFLNIAIKIVKTLADYVPHNLTIKIETTICEKVSAKNAYKGMGKFDIITMSNFLTLNEGENQSNAVTMIDNFKNSLDEYGSFIIIEPGDENSCKALKRIRNDVVSQKILNVFSPCIGIWEEKPTYDCTCFSMVRCYWQIPQIYEYLIRRGLSKAKRADVPFNYVILRKDKVKKYAPTRNIQHFTKLTNLKEHIDQTVNVMALIRTVIYKGDKVNFSICDGTCSFKEDGKAIWIDVSNDQLRQNGIDIPLIAAERITLKKVLVKLKGEKISLEINKNSRIAIDY